jgi:hypothetical protein
MKMVRIFYPDREIETKRYYPGQILEFGPDDGELPWFLLFEVPDPAHQSALDYFEGI